MNSDNKYRQMLKVFKSFVEEIHKRYILLAFVNNLAVDIFPGDLFAKSKEPSPIVILDVVVS